MSKQLEKTGKIAFWIALILETVLVMVDKSAYTNPYESMLFRVTFLLFVYKIITAKYSIKEYCIMGFIAIFMVIGYFISTRDELIRGFVFVVSCKDIFEKAIFKMIFFITGIMAIFLFLLAYFGIFGSMFMEADFGRGGTEIRYCFGMGHPNAFHCMFWLLIFLCLYLYHTKMKWYHYILLCVSNIGMYLFTTSSTGLIIITLTIIGFLALKIENKKVTLSIYIVGTLIFLACIGFSCYGASVGDGNTFMHKLDDFLNGRYKYAYLIEDARINNWMLFSQPGNTEFFDAGFIRLVYWYGIVPALLYIGANLYLIYLGFRYKKHELVIMVVLFSIYSIMEAHFISVYLLRNYCLVALGCNWYLIFQNKKQYNPLTQLWEKKE